MTTEELKRLRGCVTSRFRYSVGPAEVIALLDHMDAEKAQADDFFEASERNVSDIREQRDAALAENAKLRAALQAVFIDSIECPDSSGQYFFTNWSMEKVRKALALKETK